ncbi:MAG: formylglycine-generating enzyme family protein [Planctomycetaceae bacterium]|nr:formylglycine-generating enzyme family protein [Planctomycetaceae bacterium]
MRSLTSNHLIAWIPVSIALVLYVGPMLAGNPNQAEPSAPSASRPATTSQTARLLWDGKETIAEYARRAGITQTEVILDLGSGVTLKAALIPAGNFIMGTAEKDCPDDQRPQHKVTITRPFYVGVYEVTQEQWTKVMGTRPQIFKGDAKLPVETVSRNDAMDFCKKVTDLTKRKVRLLTEAEWEYACRAGSATRFCFGDDDRKLKNYAWYQDNGKGTSHPVGQKEPNAWGLYDMHGNVLEWCSDWFTDSYANAEAVDPTGPSTEPLINAHRVLRGGCFWDGSLLCRSSYRIFGNPNGRGSQAGFRIAVELQ